MEYRLRPWASDDLESLKYANNYNVAKNMSDVFPHPYSVEVGKAFIAFAKKDTLPNILAIEINGEAAGGIGIHPQSDIYRKNAELGYWLAESYWGRGTLSTAIIQIVEYSFRHLDIVRTYARPFGANRASQKALEKAGFTLQTRLSQTFYKNGEYIDELFMLSDA